MTQQRVDYYPQFAPARVYDGRRIVSKSRSRLNLAARKVSRRLSNISISANTIFQVVSFASLIAVVLGIWANWSRLEDTRQTLWGHWLGVVMVTSGTAFFIINLVAFVWQLVLAWRYRQAAFCTDEQLPTCTVIVPAYNEGRQVLETIRSIMANNYPHHKMQVLAVDDGSRDDTWAWMRAAAEEFKGRVQAIKMNMNQGKRHALYEGFKRATGEVLITVDSDSVVEKEALRRLVSPFFHDKKVGAVAGNVRVLNRRDGIIPRMLDVSFVFSFDFVRSCQSETNAVFCTPGALSAYRRDLVLKLLEPWMNQTFRGRVANHGEDRHMTNLILKEGFHVTYQKDALVWTNVPTEYMGLCRMFLRWARSNVRETIIMSQFVFKKFRPTPATGARINLGLAWLSLTITQVFLLVSIACLIWRPDVFGLHLLLGIAVSSCVPAAMYAWRARSVDAIYAYVYGVFWFFFLSWITPYALVTAHYGGWLTRDAVRNVKTSVSATTLEQAA